MPQLYRVFVSSCLTRRGTERIADLLRARGARPFLDVYDIAKGDDIPEWIRRELNRAGELVALLTSASQQRAWVWAEIAFGGPKITNDPVVEDNSGHPIPGL